MRGEIGFCWRTRVRVRLCVLSHAACRFGPSQLVLECVKGYSASDVAVNVGRCLRAGSGLAGIVRRLCVKTFLLLTRAMADRRSACVRPWPFSSGEPRGVPSETVTWMKPHWLTILAVFEGPWCKGFPQSCVAMFPTWHLSQMMRLCSPVFHKYSSATIADSLRRCCALLS